MVASAMNSSLTASPAELRFRVVVRAFLDSAEAAHLINFRDDEVHLVLDGSTLLVVILDHSATEEELLAQLEAAAFAHQGKLRIVVVSERPWVQSALAAVKRRASASCALYAIAVDGTVWSQSSLLVSELRPALKRQAESAPKGNETREEFHAELRQGLAKTSVKLEDAQAFAASMSSRPVWVTYALLTLYVLMFALSYAFGSPENIATLVLLGAEVPARIRQGEWWRLLSATALHGGWLHLMMNGIVLFSLGPFLERLLGWGRFLTLYVLSGLLGSLLGTLLAPLLKFGISVGASGALFGLLGASAVLGFKPSGLPEFLARDLKKSAVQNMVINVINSFRPHIDWAAHLGGALVGLLLFWTGLMRPRLGSADSAASRRSDRVYNAIGALLGAALLSCIGLSIMRGQPWQLQDSAAIARHSLGSTQLSFEAPQSLGQLQSMSKNEEFEAYELGGIEFGQTLSVLVSPLKISAEDEAAKDLIWQLSVKALRDFRPPFQATRIGEPSEETINGRPAVVLNFKLDNGARYIRLAQLERRHLVIFELVTPPNLPDRQRIDLRRVAESLRDDAPAPHQSPLDQGP